MPFSAELKRIPGVNQAVKLEEIRKKVLENEPTVEVLEGLSKFSASKVPPIPDRAVRAHVRG